MSDLPEFNEPPVVEMAIGVQFVPLQGLQGLPLAPLRERWRPDYPKILEQPALPPSIEDGPPMLPALQVRLIPSPPVRQWFLNDAETELVQLQADRLLVNWRSGDAAAAYPRYGYMRQAFELRFRDLSQFAKSERLGEIAVTQAELSYINVINVNPDELGRMDTFLRSWSGTSGHHLGQPAQSRLTLTFSIPDLGVPPVRLYVEVNPARRPSGEDILFLTLTVRGYPGGRELADTLKFFDEAHSHLVRSFAELTTESMHTIWQRHK